MTALDPSKQGIEAQKLISISLGKMAASRVCGSSLHKSLLVASVLHRARHVFLEENYHIYENRYTMPPTPPPSPPPPPPQDGVAEDEHDEGGFVVSRMPLADASNQQQRVVALKRRRCVSDKETQDAVSSILPKRFRSSTTTTPPIEEQVSSSPQVCATDDFACASENVLVPISVSENALSPICAEESSPAPLCANENVLPEGARDSTTTSNPIYCTLEPISDDEEDDDDDDDDDDVNSMEVEHITSLVSIFSFGAPRKDMCATQAAREEPAQFTPVALAV